MILFLKILVIILVLLVFHEMGHVVAAKMLKLKVIKIGAKLFPAPHFYVTVVWPIKKYQRHIYLFSGFFLTCVLFCICIYFKFFNLEVIYIAFAVQFAIELNPFYSDFVISLNMHNSSNHNEAQSIEQNIKNYLFSPRWYVHFIIWTIIIIVFIQFKPDLL